jgi:hypothetical protein
LRKLLENKFSLPKGAVDWLMMLYDAAQMFDDIADGDEITRDTLNSVLWNVFIDMPMNPFYRANADTLWPVMANAILKWQGSDRTERLRSANAMSFVWRASIYDVVLMVYAIIHGHKKAAQNADRIMAIYGESFDDYMEEMKHA